MYGDGYQLNVANRLEQWFKHAVHAVMLFLNTRNAQQKFVTWLKFTGMM
jgi:hypothetical protein